MPEAADDGLVPSRDEIRNATPELRGNIVGMSLLHAVITLYPPSQGRRLTGFLLDKDVSEMINMVNDPDLVEGLSKEAHEDMSREFSDIGLTIQDSSLRMDRMRSMAVLKPSK